MPRPSLVILDDVDRLADLQAQIRELTSEADSIKTRLRDDYRDDQGTHVVGAHKVSVTVTRRFDETKAREILPPNIVDACTVSTLSSALVKRAVAPALYELCGVEGDLRVAVV